jgi:hypothetical protein
MRAFFYLNGTNTIFSRRNELSLKTIYLITQIELRWLVKDF